MPFCTGREHGDLARDRMHPDRRGLEGVDVGNRPDECADRLVHAWLGSHEGVGADHERRGCNERLPVEVEGPQGARAAQPAARRFFAGDQQALPFSVEGQSFGVARAVEPGVEARGLGLLALPVCDDEQPPVAPPAPRRGPTTRSMPS